ncbi:MAG TPA: methyltransferase domain-containing protein [Tepidisphaeraceae bacterium]|nr:methyltransferase domain-containing protein [Tepidisphaeraceae bacterium]
MAAKTQDYLEPYRQAASRHGDRFASLLWASPKTQAARFDAICRLADLRGRRVLDAGCGRGDLMDFLVERGVQPREYIGIEAVDELAAAAMRKKLPGAQIIHGDFVREPQRLKAGADVIVFSGSLNTLEPQQFYQSLRQGWEAAGEVLVFNFLAAAHIASAQWLTWHRAEDVLVMARSWSSEVRMLEDYLDGDCTIALWKRGGICGKS